MFIFPNDSSGGAGQDMGLGSEGHWESTEKGGPLCVDRVMLSKGLGKAEGRYASSQQAGMSRAPSPLAAAQDVSKQQSCPCPTSTNAHWAQALCSALTCMISSTPSNSLVVIPIIQMGTLRPRGLNLKGFARLYS